MPDPLRPVLDAAAAAVLRGLAGRPAAACRTVAAADGVYCFVAVGPAGGPFAARVPGPRRNKDGGKSAALEADILGVLAAGRRCTKEVLAALEGAGKGYGPSSVSKCLAALRRRGAVTHDRAAGGYALPGVRPRPHQPGLFDHVRPGKPPGGKSRKVPAG